VPVAPIHDRTAFDRAHDIGIGDPMLKPLVKVTTAFTGDTNLQSGPQGTTGQWLGLAATAL
jgi:hypothetical protein